MELRSVSILTHPIDAMRQFSDDVGHLYVVALHIGVLKVSVQIVAYVLCHLNSR